MSHHNPPAVQGFTGSVAKYCSNPVRHGLNADSFLVPLFEQMHTSEFTKVVCMGRAGAIVVGRLPQPLRGGGDAMLEKAFSAGSTFDGISVVADSNKTQGIVNDTPVLSS